MRGDEDEGARGDADGGATGRDARQSPRRIALCAVDVDAAVAACGLDALVAALADDPDRRARLARIRHPDGRARSAVGALLARRMAAARLGGDPAAVRFGSAPHGRPYVLGAPGLWHSVAHSGRWVVCAVADGPVGVDVELLRPVDVLRLARRFSPAERAALTALAPPAAPAVRARAGAAPDEPDRRAEEVLRRAFFAIWTAKESYVKALGLGLRVPLASFTAALGGAGDGTVALSGPDGRPLSGWSARAYALDASHPVALCARAGRRRFPTRILRVAPALLHAIESARDGRSRGAARGGRR